VASALAVNSSIRKHGRPTGGALQYVVSNFQTSKGVALEGKGVVPDSAVKPTRAALLAGRDTALEKALRYAGK